MLIVPNHNLIGPYKIHLLYLHVIASGEIVWLDYGKNEKKSWVVHTDCESVRLRSSMFELELSDPGSWGDIVTIGETEYTSRGNSYTSLSTNQIDTILSTNFTVGYNLDGVNTDVINKGFLLDWSCTQWGEWEPLDNGNCGLVKRPSDNGTMTTGPLKYKASKTCSK